MVYVFKYQYSGIPSIWCFCFTIETLYFQMIIAGYILWHTTCVVIFSDDHRWLYIMTYYIVLLYFQMIIAGYILWHTTCVVIFSDDHRWLYIMTYYTCYIFRWSSLVIYYDILHVLYFQMIIAGYILWHTTCVVIFSDDHRWLYIMTYYIVLLYFQMIIAGYILWHTTCVVIFSDDYRWLYIMTYYMCCYIFRWSSLVIYYDILHVLLYFQMIIAGYILWHTTCVVIFSDDHRWLYIMTYYIVLLYFQMIIAGYILWHTTCVVIFSDDHRWLYIMTYYTCYIFRWSSLVIYYDILHVLLYFQMIIAGYILWHTTLCCYIFRWLSLVIYYDILHVLLYFQMIIAGYILWHTTRVIFSDDHRWLYIMTYYMCCYIFRWSSLVIYYDILHVLLYFQMIIAGYILWHTTCVVIFSDDYRWLYIMTYYMCCYIFRWSSLVIYYLYIKNRMRQVYNTTLLAVHQSRDVGTHRHRYCIERSLYHPCHVHSVASGWCMMGGGACLPFLKDPP